MSTQYTFPQCNDALDHGQILPIDDFYQQARAGRLPNFTYLEPKWGYGKGKLDGSGFYCEKILGKVIGSQGNDYHPPTWMGPGEAFVNAVYESLIANPSAWARTLLIVTFDEHGGTYDHVDPGWGAIPPDQHHGPDGFGFNRYGVRVPTLLISPWIAAGTVFRSNDSRLKLDHTSLIATLLGWRGVDPGAAGLGARVAKAPTFEMVLADQPRTGLPRFHVPASYDQQARTAGFPAQRRPCRRVWAASSAIGRAHPNSIGPTSKPGFHGVSCRAETDQCARCPDSEEAASEIA